MPPGLPDARDVWSTLLYRVTLLLNNLLQNEPICEFVCILRLFQRSTQGSWGAGLIS